MEARRGGEREIAHAVNVVLPHAVRTASAVELGVSKKGGRGGLIAPNTHRLFHGENLRLQFQLKAEKNRRPTTPMRLRSGITF